MRWKPDLRDADATPEGLYLGRRDFLRLGAAGAIGAAAAGIPLPAEAGADDPIGEVLKTASTVNQAGGEKPTPWKSVTTDARGNYVLALLPPEHYTIAVQASGYAQASSREIQVMIDWRTRNDMKLAPSSARTTEAAAGGRVAAR